MAEPKWDTNRHQSFTEEVEEEGSPMTFGPSEPIYDEMLQTTGLMEKIRQGHPRVLLIGATWKSVDECEDYIHRINPGADLSVMDITSIPLHGADKHIHVIQSDGRRMGLQSNSQDVIFTNLLLHHLDDKTTDFLREAFRVLKPGGGLFMLEWPMGEDYAADLRDIGFSTIGSSEATGWTRNEYLSHVRGEAINFYNHNNRYGASKMSGTAIYGIK